MTKAQGNNPRFELQELDWPLRVVPGTLGERLLERLWEERASNPTTTWANAKTHLSHVRVYPGVRHPFSHQETSLSCGEFPPLHILRAACGVCCE